VVVLTRRVEHGLLRKRDLHDSGSQSCLRGRFGTLSFGLARLENSTIFVVTESSGGQEPLQGGDVKLLQLIDHLHDSF
jgi:hypothetical protein